MTAPRARIKFVRGRWQKVEPKAEPANHFVSAIHNLNERLTRVEQALAKLTAAEATPPKRKPKKVATA
jgi:hypothetical protein